MKILADHNIPYVSEAFGTIGDVEIFSTREIPREKLKDCDVLLIRSVSRVDASVLEGTPVKMVCTATTGTDHVDLNGLESRGIAFASAPGSNANSVAEYVAAVLLELARHFFFSLKGKVLGIVGVGRIGSRVRKLAEGVGMEVLLNDPPLAEITGDALYRPLDELMDADILTLHVPLTRGGKYPTYHLFGEARLRRLRPDAVLLNTSRGPVVDNRALLRLLAERRQMVAALDVWEGEPAIDLELLRRTWLGTPHIAGHSLDGKVNGTWMIYQAVCERFSLSPRWRPEDSLPEPEVRRLRVVPEERPAEERLADVVRKIYDIWRDDGMLRRLETQPPAARPAFFDRLRSQYPVRREFTNTELVFSASDEELARMARVLGFRVKLEEE